MEGLTFDDVLLIPAYSEVTPAQVSLSTRFTRNITLDIPLVSAAMDTVTEAPMAIAMARQGGIGVIHKNMSVSAQAENVRLVKQQGLRVAAGVGVTSDTIERVGALAAAGADAVVIDTAHGHSLNVVATLRNVKDRYPDIDVVVGNIATAEAAACLVEAGADAIKVGIGPGSICTTRIVAGVGVPQLSAIFEAAKVAHAAGVPVIADGGIRYSGDAVKALAAGGDTVMLGSMLAGVDEAPGDVFVQNSRRFKAYRGMGSVSAMEAGSKDRYFQSATTDSRKFVPEGIEACVPCKGPLDGVVYQLLGGIRSGMGYAGAPIIAGLHGARFVRISSNAVLENHPHDVIITKEAPNYTCKKY